MATVAENLTTIKTNLVLLLVTETAYQVANGAKPQYSLDGESYDWPGWEEAILRKIDMLNKLIQSEDGAFEVRSYAR
jgi:hypothetical protein